MSKQCPGWLRLEGGRYAVIPEGAETVRRIYRWAAEGFGLTAILGKLNAEKVPPLGYAKHWARTYLARLLRCRQVLGELQPHKGRQGDRKPDGKPIPGYYPAVVTEEE